MTVRLDDIDWEAWDTGFVAAITYVIVGEEVLLIDKKRGLGAGMVNAPGGRLEPGESPVEAAVREVEEEVGLTVTGSLRAAGEHQHQFVDGLRLHLHVFVATEAHGTLTETDEARPFWTPMDRVPLDRMWADNRLWVPPVLAGASAWGRYVFDGDVMRDFDVRVKASPTR